MSRCLWIRSPHLLLMFAILLCTCAPSWAAPPTFVAAGTVASGTGTITPALPAGLASNDILLLFVETADQACSITNPNGGTWTPVTGSPQGTTGTRLTAFWSRYNGTQGAPTVGDSGDHQLGRMIALRGAATSGDPCDVAAGGVEATADTSGSIPGATSTLADTLVVTAMATSLPDAASTAKFSGWTNANLTSLTERTDNTVTAGNGGGLAMATGLKASAGAYGNTAVTLVNAAAKGMLSIAIKPPAAAINGATYVTQSVPSSMTAGQTYNVSVTMHNSGTTTWTAAGNYKLGSRNPYDNSTWGMHRVLLAGGDSIGPGQDKTFNWTVTAPASPGTYDFQWAMVQDGVEWFGDLTPNVPVTVTGVPTVTLSRNNVSIAETGGVCTLTATLSAISTQNVVVNLGYTGTAARGTDFTAADSITVTAGNTSNTTNITATQDSLVEGNETIIVDITGVTNGTESGTQQVAVTITDDDSPPGGLPAPWQHMDIGTSGGTASYAAPTFTIEGSGWDVNSTSDGFSYVYQPLSGDGTIIARVADVEYTHWAAKGGVMIRETLDGGSKHAAVTITPSATLAFQWRAATNDQTSVAAVVIPPPHFVKLVRSGNNFSAYESGDGNTWNQVGTTLSISMATNVYVGMCVSSHDAALCTTTFDNVSVTGGGEPQPTVTLSRNNASIAEAAGVCTVTATLDRTSTQNVTVNLGYTGTATQGTDYTAANSITVTAGNTSNTTNITATQDTTYEGNETVIVDVTSVTNGTESGTQQVSTIITDDDPPPSGSTVTDLQARYSKGQVFITFQQLSDPSVLYYVYRHTSPINSGNIGTLQPIATLNSSSGTNLHTGQRFIVTDNGSPLAAGYGLLVYTCPATTSVYYAVTNSLDQSIEGGINSLSSPVGETHLDVPGAVQLGSPELKPGGYYVTRYFAWEDYSLWNHSWWGYYGHRFNVLSQQLPFDPGQVYPLAMYLHGAGTTGYMEPSEWPQTALNGNLICPVELDLTVSPYDPYTGWRPVSGWFGYPSQGWGQGYAMNCTEKRCIRYINIIKGDQRYRVDSSRIYLYGGSMGGGGAMHMAFHNPDVFAAVAPTIGWVQPYNWNYGIWNTLFGPITNSLRVNDASGAYWWDWDDQRWLVDHMTTTPPPVIYTFGKDDTFVDPSNYPELLQKTELNKQGMFAIWQNGGHYERYVFDMPVSWYRFKKNEAYPAFANASTSTSFAAQEGQRNRYLDWSSALNDLFTGTGDAITDQATTFGMTFKSLSGADALADITFRNAQSFTVAPFASVSWSNVEHGSGTPIASGVVTADANGLVTLSQMTIKATGNRITLSN